MSTNLTHDDVESILKMIDAAEHLEEIEISHAGFRLHVIRSGGGNLRPSGSTVDFTEPAGGSRPVFTEAAQPIAASSAAAPVTSGSDDVPEGAIAVRAPMLGVFYRASAPGEKPFVEIGQHVRADDIVCLIEVMKLFSSIRAGVDGEVVKIVVANGAVVEFDQSLIYVKPRNG